MEHTTHIQSMSHTQPHIHTLRTHTHIIIYYATDLCDGWSSDNTERSMNQLFWRPNAVYNNAALRSFYAI